MIKSRIEHFIKFNHIANRMFTGIAGCFIRMLGFFVRIDERGVLFVSNIGKDFSGSPRAIYERMMELGINQKYNITWAFVDPTEHVDIGCNVVKLDSFSYFRTALSTSYWITDVNIERGLKFKRPGTSYLNTWHGTSMKTLGKDIHGRLYYDCSSIDYMCASSEYDIETLSKALGIERNHFVRTGQPRNDYLHVNKNVSSAIYKRNLGLPEGKTTILYAPTWRDSKDGGRSYTINPPIDVKKWEAELGDKFVFLVRMHPITQKAMGLEWNEFCRDFSRCESLNDLLLASDILITDYSSIAFDYSILNRPTLCFGYDVESYGVDRGLYVDPRTLFSYSMQKTEDELIGLIRTGIVGAGTPSTVPSDYNDYGGNATEECIRLLFDSRSKRCSEGVG